MDNRKKTYNKSCIVPRCKSTKVTTPNKLFGPKKLVAKNQRRRAISQNCPKCLKANRYCGEDHFNLPDELQNGLCVNDMKNFSVKVPCIKSNTSENSSELGIEITDVHNVTQKLQNFIKYEIDIDELEEAQLLSEDFPQYLGRNLVEEQIKGSEEIQTEYIVQQDQQTDEYLSEGKIQEQRQDSEDDRFEEEVNALKELHNVEIVQQQPIDIMSDDENTNGKNPTGFNFQFLNEEELEECIIVDISEDMEGDEETCKENKLEASFEKDQTEVDEDDIELPSQEEDNDSDDCIIIAEEDNSSNADMSSEKSKKNNENYEGDEITEGDILKEFQIIDEEDDVMCIEPERTQISKTIIRRKNSIYSCPLNCTFLATNRKLLIRHLINHKAKEEPRRKKRYQCPLCPYDTVYKHSFVDHIVYHEEPRFACKKCVYVAIKPSLLKTHMLTSHRVMMSCDRCWYKTRQVGNFFAHQMQCVGLRKKSKKPTGAGKVVDEDFRCHFEPCPFTATSEEALKTHEWIQHQVGSNNIKKFKCYIDYCCFETFREEAFKEHINTHPGCELQCKQCTYKTMDWKRFKDHIIRHVTSSGTT